jgi:Undecaprenyl-phosphate glucose phosphotransferase
MASTRTWIAPAFDVALTIGSAALITALRVDGFSQFRTEALCVACAAALVLAIFPLVGVYDSWRGRSLVQWVTRIACAWAVVQACNLVLMFALHVSADLSRLWFADWSALTGASLALSRVLVQRVLAHVRHAGLNLRGVAIVARPEHRSDLTRKIAGAPESGFVVGATLDVYSGGDPQAGDAAFERFAATVREEGIREVWLALPLSEERTILRCTAAFQRDLVNIRFIPDMRSLVVFNGGMVDLLGTPAINLVALPLSPDAIALKALFDRVFAALALAALAPLMLLIALAVKLSSPGPVLFTQRRKGADGRPFTIYKFRTMRAHGQVAGVVRQATKGDPRVTRIGAFLRRTSLDELPQFVNVLRGDMSVVGPRPHALEHDALYAPLVDGYIHRYRIKPGITGWAQVNGLRGETDRIEKMQRRVDFDLYYLRNWSFGLDLRIIAATLVKGFASPSAY